ncbi:protein deadpan-like [Pollicipes pollicipes]|uniref:protein deadpan-like n=1 Tax=Pollicipes pollicipes TaxID=41117 RepID=UPI001885705F|nr:protein deadpan-like [Pollicipes pollicipes]
MPSSERPSENRRMNKPIMEKRRRARINDCLNELKSLVLEGLKKDPARHSKLEKADILEMAVKHLRSLQTRPGATQARFQQGYADCAREVASYLESREGLDQEAKQRLMVHLASSCRPLSTSAAPAPTSASAAVPTLLGGLQLVAAVLPGGELGYIVQTRQPVGSLSPPPSWEPTDAGSPASPASSCGSFGSSEGRPTSPRPLDLVAHNRGPEDEAHWRPW